MATTTKPSADAAPAGPGRKLPRALQRFLDTESSGAAVLLFFTGAALVWANSPWRASYDAFWKTELTLELGHFARSEDLRHLVNEALMALFFFVVGLEIKHELVAGSFVAGARRPSQRSQPSGGWQCRRRSSSLSTSAARGVGDGESLWPPTSRSP